MFDAFDDDFDEDDEFIMGVKEITAPKRSRDCIKEIVDFNSTNKRTRSDINANTDKMSSGTVMLKPPMESQNSFKMAKKKFPGPAGLLPETPIDDFSNSTLNKSHSFINEEIENNANSSQTYLDTQQQDQNDWFNKPTWITMKQDISNSLNKSDRNILEKFTIKWIFQQVDRNINFSIKKVPLLRVILTSLTNEEGNVHTASFRDLTGVIKGSIHHKIIEKYRLKVHPGCVFVLHQVGIFTPSRRKHYLCITENNVICIYASNQDSNVICEKLKPLNWFDLVQAAETSIKELGTSSNLQEDLKHLTKSPIHPNNSPYANAVKEHMKPSSSRPQLSPLLSASCTPQATMQKTPVTQVKEDNKSNQLSLDDDFGDDTWSDDDFESLVSDIKM